MQNSPIRLLIVEDEAIIAENMKLTLEELGYDVVKVCLNYQSARQAIETEDFDLAILDINLNNDDHKSGFTLAKHLKAHKCIPHIFLTAYSDLDTTRQALNHQPSAYLVKPANKATLFSTIELAINNHQFPTQTTKLKEQSECFYNKIGNNIVKVEWKDVVLMHAIKNYVEIKTLSNSSTYLLRTSLRQCFDNLLPVSLRDKFLKINRSTILNTQVILDFSRAAVRTTIGEYPLSKPCYSELYQRFYVQR